MAISYICKKHDLMQIKVNDNSVWMGRDIDAGIAVEKALIEIKDILGVSFEIEFYNSDGKLFD